MGRAVVPVAGQRVATGQGLLVVEQEGFVAGVEVDLAEIGEGVTVDPASRHELNGPVDLVGEVLVALSGRAVGHELAVPLVDSREGGEPAFSEGSQQVQGSGGSVVGQKESCGVGGPFVGREPDVIDDVAPEGGELDTVHRFGIAGPGLRELAGDPTDLHHGYAGVVRENDRHLEDHPEPVANGVGGRVEGFGTVAGLEQEGSAFRDGGQLLGELAGFAGEYQWREVTQLVEDLVVGVGVRPLGLLEGHAVAPGPGGPTGIRPRRGGCIHGFSLRATRQGAAGVFRPVGADGPESGGVDDLGGPVAHSDHGTLDQASGGLGGYTQVFANLAVAALAPVGEAEALLDGIAGTMV